MKSFINFSGHFHPLLVHLPIGFLVLAILFQWMLLKERYRQLQPAVGISFLLGFISAVFSCFTGLALSSNGEYDASTLLFHQWFGIAVALISFIAYKVSSKPFDIWKKVISTITFVLIIITGHLGGTLTHGEGFLAWKSANSGSNGQPERKPIINLQEAIVFNDIIQPVLNEKCTGCHSAVKQKGGLRLDGKDWVQKGGKNGKVYVAGNVSASELYKRVILDPLEEKHMPPKGKPQLTESEISLLHWWINANAEFDKKVRETGQPEKIKATLQALLSAPATASKKISVPEIPVQKASQAVIDSLRKDGVAVSPVAMNSNYLQVSFVSIPRPEDKLTGLLRKISKQLIWLKLPGVQLSPNGWKTVSACKALTRLSIERSNINDTSVQWLNELHQLQYLNMVGTNVTAQGVRQLVGLAKLSKLYLGQTAVKLTDFLALQQLFQKTIIDSGNYHVATLATDTQLVKAPPVKK